MGIEGLPSRLKKCVGPKRQVDTIASSSERNACVVGMDISCTIMAGVRSKTGAEDIMQIHLSHTTMQPDVYLTKSESIIKRILK